MRSNCCSGIHNSCMLQINAHSHFPTNRETAMMTHAPEIQGLSRSPKSFQKDRIQITMMARASWKGCNRRVSEAEISHLTLMIKSKRE